MQSTIFTLCDEGSKLQREVSLISVLWLREEIGMKNAGISWRLRIISPFCIQVFALVNQVLRFWAYPLFLVDVLSKSENTFQNLIFGAKIKSVASHAMV